MGMEAYQNRNIESINYFMDKFDLICRYSNDVRKKICIKDSSSDKKVCRFCGKDDTEVSFKNKAHAMPELLGNKSIVLINECDNCNKFIGQELEDQLGKYLAPFRTISHILGKNGVPRYKSNDGSLRIDWKDNIAYIQTLEGCSAVQFDEDNTCVTIELQRDAYIPIDVYRCFVEMSLAVIDTEEYLELKKNAAWVRLDRKTVDGEKGIKESLPFAGQYASNVFETFIPGPYKAEPTIWIFKRKEDVCDVPTYISVVEFGNYRYQFCIPSEKDYGNKVVIERFVGYEAMPENDIFVKKYGIPNTRIVDFSGNELRKNDKVSISLKYDYVEGQEIDKFENIDLKPLEIKRFRK